LPGEIPYSNLQGAGTPLLVGAAATESIRGFISTVRICVRRYFKEDENELQESLDPIAVVTIHRH